MDGIDSTGKKMKFCQLYAKQNAQRANGKKSTKKQREQPMRLLKEDKLDARSIDTIKSSDAKEWSLRRNEKGFSHNTINNHKRSLKASFYIAIQDDYVRKNPFVFFNHKGKPKVAIDYSTLFVRMVKIYNKHHKDNPLPHITPHILMHTFCTKMAQRNMNPKDLQYIMGHSNISITMDWHAHSSIESAKTEIKRLIA